MSMKLVPAAKGEKNTEVNVLDKDAITIVLRRLRGEMVKSIQKDYPVPKTTIRNWYKGIVRGYVLEEAKMLYEQELADRYK